MAGKPRNKPSIQEQIENAKEGEMIEISSGTYISGATIPSGVVVEDNISKIDAKVIELRRRTPEEMEAQFILAISELVIAKKALDRISVIHDHVGSCSKNCPALIAKEALRKIRG
jgi:hypothetical protein